MVQRIDSSTLARGNGVSVNNVASKIVAQKKPMKVIAIGAALAANTSGGTYTANYRTVVRSADEVGKLAGFGSTIHRMAKGIFAGNGGKTEVSVVIQAEQTSPAAVAGSGSIAITHVATANGNLYLYVDGTRYVIPITSSLAADNIGDLIEDALNNDPDCPVTATNTSGTVALVSKSKGTNANDINISLNQRKGETVPTGLTSTITPMASGANDPAIATALAALGAGDDANVEADTHLVVAYGRLDSSTLAAISAYNGTANNVEGCYLDTVGRPLVCFWGDTDPGTDALDALETIANGVKETDKTNWAIPRPNSPTNPFYIAGVVAGALSAISQKRPEQPSGGVVLVGVEPGPLAALAAATGDWCKEQTYRDEAVKAGVGTTKVVNGVVQLDNLVSFYHPTTIDAYSNCYRLHNNTWKVANQAYNVRNLLESDYFKGITIVDDVAKVTSQDSREKVMDRDLIFGFIAQLVYQFEKNAWIWSAASTLDLMKDDLDSYIVLRAGGLGYDVILPVYLSGSGEIFTVSIRVDANSASAQ